MQRPIGWMAAVLLSSLPAGAAEDAPAPVPAVVESTMPTGSGQIRQFALDGDAGTYFASDRNAEGADHFTILLDRPVELKSIDVVTGRPDGRDRLDAGRLEVSTDGETFEEIAKFSDGTAHAEAAGRSIRRVRLRPGADMDHPLAIREITIVSDPPIATFRYPVEFVVNVDDAPEMKEWAEKAAQACERAYPMINEELKTEGYKPPHLIRLTMKTSYNGVAMAGGTRITGSVKFFKAHPDDVGAMVHETAHVVQNYRGRGNPSWLVEGVADYVRFFKYEPDKLGRIDPNRARYNSSYRVTAAFLAYVTDKYDKALVIKLNKAMREGAYKEDLFKDLTGKTVQELGEEWRETLKG